jgi:hypothetical protein
VRDPRLCFLFRLLNNLITYFFSFLDFRSTVSSLEPKITVSVKEVGDLLSHIKGGGQVSLTQPSQRNAVSTEAEDSLKPLMDLLDGT